MQVPETVVEILVCGWCLESGMALSELTGTVVTKDKSLGHTAQNFLQR